MDYIEEANNIAANKGGRCLSTSCPKAKSRLEWECKVGHRWSALFINVRNKGNWCKKCIRIAQRKTIEDCKKLADANEGQCLSINYENNFAKLKWKCKNNHIWEATYNKISIGRWCPYCSKKVKHTIEIAKQIAEQYGGECLSSDYKNLITKLLWRCKEKHIWWASLNAVKNGNKWCRKCATAAARKYDLNFLNSIAKEKDGRCLSIEYTNYNSKIKWQCKDGHLWEASLSSIKSRDTWCPFCSKKSKIQCKLAKIIENILLCDVLLNCKKFPWLKLKNGRQELDIYVPKYKLAIEYDGKQHFEPINYFGGMSKFKRIKTLDKIKNKKISENSQDVKYFIRFNYKEKITTEYVIEKLKLYGVPINGADFA